MSDISKFQFRAALKLVRDKYGNCFACGVSPLPGQKWSACSGCKSKLYCTKQCQVSHWKAHKTECKRLQAMYKACINMDNLCDPSRGLPPIIERIVLLDDFVVIHTWSFATAVHAARKTLVPPLDHNTDMMSFQLSYRPDNGGNPAKAFKLADAVVYPLNDVLKVPRAHDGWELGKDSREREARLYRTVGCRFDGFLPVCYSIDNCDYTHWASHPLLWPDAEREAEIDRESDYENPVFLLSSYLWNGLVANPEDIGTANQRVGKMVKEGKHWKWRQLCQGVELEIPPPCQPLVNA